MLCYRCGSHVPDGSPKCGTCGQAFTGTYRRSGGPPPVPKRIKSIDVPGAYKVGQRIAGRYEVKQVLGQGPIGIVYRALDREVDVQVVVKVVTSKLMQSEEEREVFRREARLARDLSHPNIVRIYEEGFDGDRPYLVMQHLEGLTLRKIIDLRHGKGQRFEVRELEPIFAQLCLALTYAHEQGVAHGNLKPGNVIVLPDLLKVTDFREACFVPRVPFIAAQKVRGGTERYLAPEVIAGQDVSPAADLYSLGVLLGEMLTGEVYDPAKGLDLHVARDDLPRAMDSIFKKLTASRPKDRYASAEQFMEDFTAVLAGGLPRHAGALREAGAGARARRAPVEEEGPELLHTGEFEILPLDEDAEATPSVAPPRRERISFGVDGPAPPPVPEEALADVEETDAGDEDEIPTVLGRLPPEQAPLEEPPTELAARSPLDEEEPPTLLDARALEGPETAPGLEPEPLLEGGEIIDDEILEEDEILDAPSVLGASDREWTDPGGTAAPPPPPTPALVGDLIEESLADDEALHTDDGLTLPGERGPEEVESLTTLDGSEHLEALTRAPTFTGERGRGAPPPVSPAPAPPRRNGAAGIEVPAAAPRAAGEGGSGWLLWVGGGLLGLLGALVVFFFFTPVGGAYWTRWTGRSVPGASTRGEPATKRPPGESLADMGQRPVAA
ncbi:MAG: serine/threonine protein kinase, partial [Deltaproteobacteria bacterium]